MDFSVYSAENLHGGIFSPYAGKDENDDWLPGYISTVFLQKHFGHCKDIDECIQATESEGLRLFFKHLKLKNR